MVRLWLSCNYGRNVVSLRLRYGYGETVVRFWLRCGYGRNVVRLWLRCGYGRNVSTNSRDRSAGLLDQVEIYALNMIQKGIFPCNQ